MKFAIQRKHVDGKAPVNRQQLLDRTNLNRCHVLACESCRVWIKLQTDLVNASQMLKGQPRDMHFLVVFADYVPFGLQSTQGFTQRCRRDPEARRECLLIDASPWLLTRLKGSFHGQLHRPKSTLIEPRDSTSMVTKWTSFALLSIPCPYSSVF